MMLVKLIPWLLACTVLGCTNSDFSGGAGRKGQEDSQQGDSDSGTPDAADSGGQDLGVDSDDQGGSSGGDLGNEADTDTGNSSGGGNDDDDLIFDEDEQWKPQRCTADNGEISFGECPKGHAAFLSDDGSSTRVGCCPLPSRDILDRDHDPESRGSCLGDEIAVGASGNGFLCQRINTDKYKLSPARIVCYWGSGAAGNDGASDCGTVISELKSLMNKTGDKDGCAAQPYGAVMQQKFGKDCGDQRSVQIIDRDTDDPIEMFP